jgi:hypothetical protein
MFEVSSVGKVEVEPKSGRFLRANAAMCRLVGYSDAELLARTIYDITHPDDRNLGRPQQLETGHPRKVGVDEGASFHGDRLRGMFHEVLDGMPIRLKETADTSANMAIVIDHKNDACLCGNAVQALHGRNDRACLLVIEARDECAAIPNRSRASWLAPNAPRWR